MIKSKIAIVVSHPIQHFCPQYSSWASNENISLKVFFASALGYKDYYDPQFKKTIVWDNLNLDTFDHVFMNNEKVLQPDADLDAEELEGELLKFKPDVLILYGYFQKLQRRGYKWAIKHHVPIAYISDAELKQKRNIIKTVGKYFYLRSYFRKISYFLTVGDSNEQFYRFHGVKASKLIRMHFPIDIKFYEKQYLQRKELKNEILKDFNIGDQEINLGVVGKLAPWKNQGHLISAIKYLEDKGVVLNLFIIGSGDMEENLKKMRTQIKSSKVFFTGFTEISELPKYYAALDIYIHPASIEPHSIAISEAIFMGCPVILSDRCGSYGNTDDVIINKNGLVFEFGNIKELSERISLLINNKDMREDFGVNSHLMSEVYQSNAHFGTMKKLLAKININ